MEFILHKGLIVKLRVDKARKNVYSSKEVIYMPEGKCFSVFRYIRYNCLLILT